ncbi:hypothetical protein SAMN04487788_2342 [Microbacterium testaceum StLB037]|uniref:Uncharacterized protein n=1 Tax=Microbacterium testaceum (strain StLB037) TaxID=979556 RepID=A0A1H0QK37_MICTS|nr:hypothetical protein SAMN04487788_2342 [Microbacterium testaceum StLB037]
MSPIRWTAELHHLGGAVRRDAPGGGADGLARLTVLLRLQDLRHAHQPRPVVPPGVGSEGEALVGEVEVDAVARPDGLSVEVPPLTDAPGHVLGGSPDEDVSGVGREGRGEGPLVARNAHFNINVLGVEVAEYLVDHYGAMADGLNRGDASDRLLARWVLADSPGGPVDPGLIRARVAVPADIAQVRSESPAEAAQWRRRVREDFLAHLSEGLRVVGFDGGAYRFGRP